MAARGSRVAAVLFGAITAASPGYTQSTTVGPSTCVACHDHERQGKAWQKDEPARLGGKAHFNTLQQLEAPKAAGFAKAVGLGSPYDLGGSCVKCHATVFKGDANAGVSCESCHGAAASYNTLHQVKGSYAKAVAAGLRDLRGHSAEIARTCVACHLTADARLLAAGHPSGERWDAGTALAKIVHWTTAYDSAEISAAGRSAMAALRRSVAVSATAPARTALPEPPAPWDWDQPVAALPKGYVPRPRPAGGGSIAVSAEPARAPGALSLAEDSPLPLSRTGFSAGPKGTAPGDARQRAMVLLTQALRAGAKTPGQPAPSPPAEFQGSDSELLRIEDEAMALALETLRKETAPE